MPAVQKNAETSSDPSALDEEAVRVRAYEISLSEDAGTPEENWCRAEQELRKEAEAA